MVDFEVTSIIHAGVIFIVYLFIAIILFFAFSVPVDAIFDGLDDSASHTIASDEMTSFLPGIRWGVNAAFALGIAFPITWFIMWVFSQDPFEGLIRRTR